MARFMMKNHLFRTQSFIVIKLQLNMFTKRRYSLKQGIIIVSYYDIISFTRITSYYEIILLITILLLYRINIVE